MSFFARLRNLILPRRAPDEAEGPQAERFIYVKIPGKTMPMERGERYEDPLDDLLRARGLGEVSGGGTSLGEPPFCGVDVEAPDRERALVLLREELPRLDAPVGVELHYTRDGVPLLDVLGAGGWALGLLRTERHPGFGF